MKIEEKGLVSDLTALRIEAAPVGFTFDEAAEVFLPAFIDHWAEGSPEADEAFRIRSLFKARVTQALASVEVSKDRTRVTVKLRNDKVDSFELPDADEGTFGPAELDASDMAELDARRRQSMRRGQLVSNQGLNKAKAA